MTDQEVLDTIMNGLRKQGIKSLNGGGGCAYRGLNGTKCAVGMLIPDEDYTTSMEGTLYDPLLSEYLTGKGYNFALLVSLQCVHDAYQPSEWEEAFERVANKYGLIYRRSLCLPGS